MLLTFLVLPIAGLPVHATDRTDVVDENYLNGYLRWNGGKGAIDWTGDEPTEDDAKPGNRGPGSTDVFVSAPVPRTLYLNASRVIQVDLFTKGSGWAVVELRVGSTFLAGARTYAVINYCTGTGRQYCADPSLRPQAPGYIVGSFRMQPELDTIPQGSVLELCVVQTDSTRQPRYGLTGDHTSVVRLPVFSADEVLFRIPKYTSGRAPSSGTPPLADVSSVSELLDKLPKPAAAPASALLVPLGFASLRRRTGGTSLLVVSLLLAGCAAAPAHERSVAPGAAPTGGTATAYGVDDQTNETGLVSASKGALYGTVMDPERIPVNGAFVVLLSTPHSARTDAYGRFRFVDLTPGEYRLRVDRVGFVAFEDAFTVEASRITKVEVALAFEAGVALTQRPHRHDYWQKDGKAVEAIDIVNEPFEFLGGVRHRFRLPDTALILPGTTDIEVNLTWTGNWKAYLTAVRADDRNESGFYPRTSGVPFHFRTTWEMTDAGHAAHSDWGLFDFWPLGQPDCSGVLITGFNAPACLTSPSPNYHLRITIHKGVVPLEPAHPDRWGGATEIGLATEVPTKLKPQCWNELCPVDPDLTPYGCAFQGKVCPTPFNDRPVNATLQLPVTVPFETETLTVTATADRSLTTADPQEPWSLFYRTGLTGNGGDCQPMASYNRDASRRATLTRAESDLFTWTWTARLGPGEPDGPYARKTAWCFYLAPVNAVMASLDVDSQWANSNPFVKPVSFAVTVMAARSPAAP